MNREILQRPHLSVRRYFALAVIAIVILMLSSPALSSNASLRKNTAAGDWPTYLYTLARSGFNSNETIISPGSAGNLKLHWSRQGTAQIVSEPVLANGLLYWGSYDGLEHASDPQTGIDVWTTYLGQTPFCPKQPSIGVISTATVASVVINGAMTTVDFVGGGNAQFYALNANTGAILWQTQLGIPPNAFIYGSPALYNGSIYIGISSVNDCPIVQGKTFQLDAVTGTIQHTFNVVPNGCLGGGVWSSPTIDATTNRVYFSTGNSGLRYPCPAGEPFGSALLVLSTTDLSLVTHWKVPKSQSTADNDFGATPTFFTATIGGVTHQMVGLINKNGIYYAFDRNRAHAGPLWQVQLALPGKNPAIGAGSISSSASDGVNLYVGTGAATINGASCAGSVTALNQNSGAILWQLCLSNPVLAPVIGVPGLVVAGVGPTMYVFDASTGNTLFSYPDTNTNSLFWGAATISNGVLYEGNMDGNLYAFGL